MNESEWNQSVDLRRESDFQDGEALEAVQPTPVLDQLAQQVDKLASTEDMLKRAIEAAEHNQITERLLERRNEVKDFASTSTEQAQYAARLGDVLATHQTASNIQATQASHSHAAPKSGIQRLLHGTSLYDQAIRYGVAGALCALTIAILITIAISS